MLPIAHGMAKVWREAMALLLVDCEEDRTLRAVLVVMLREGDRYT